MTPCVVSYAQDVWMLGASAFEILRVVYGFPTLEQEPAFAAADDWGRNDMASALRTLALDWRNT